MPKSTVFLEPESLQMAEGSWGVNFQSLSNYFRGYLWSVLHNGKQSLFIDIGRSSRAWLIVFCLFFVFWGLFCLSNSPTSKAVVPLVCKGPQSIRVGVEERIKRTEEAMNGDQGNRKYRLILYLTFLKIILIRNASKRKGVPLSGCTREETVWGVGGRWGGYI